MQRLEFYARLTGNDVPIGAHLLGVDGVAVRGEVRRSRDGLTCELRAPEPAALSLLWTVSGSGRLQLETTRLPPRERPYNLHVELARHRLMRISQKREEWGLFDYSGLDDIADRIEEARGLFVEALQAGDDAPAAALLADRALGEALAASEQLSSFHANVFVNRRLQSSGMPRSFFGTALTPADAARPELLEALRPIVDFGRVSFSWREIQPREHTIEYAAHDAAVKAVAKAGLTVRGGPLLSLGVSSMPDWMYVWENDHEAIIKYAGEHIRRTVQRYAGQVHSWIVASGVHADAVFTLSFEQIIELTRTAVAAAREGGARTGVVIELVQPWGEYYARNQRTIPPALYAEMIVQAGIPFDALGVQLLVGLGAEGFHMRDLFQISAHIDRLATFGKPIHLTAVAAPSHVNAAAPDGGAWRAPWSEQTQQAWLAALAEIALSKPYVESFCLQAPVDQPDSVIPSSGVLRPDLSPKEAAHALIELRRRTAPPAKK